MSIKQKPKNIIAAVSADDSEQLISLLEEQLKEQTTEQRMLDSALYTAVSLNQYNSTKILLEYGADPNSKLLENSVSIIIIASFAQQNHPIAELLVEHGANLYEKDEGGYRPIDAARYYYQDDMMVDTLEEVYNEVNIAKFYKDTDTADLLLDNKADPNYALNFLYAAVEYGYTNIVKLLIPVEDQYDAHVSGEHSTIHADEL